MSNSFIVLMGVGTVFIGLICIVFLCIIISAVCRAFGKKTEMKEEMPETENKPQSIEDRQAIIAAVSAVIAEELGKDISAIRVLSFKKL